MTQRLLFWAVVLLGASGCTRYEYEEEAFVEIDGSGSIRVSGSQEILEVLVGRPLDSVESLAALVTGGNVSLASARETERDDRRFFHVEGRFHDWNDLCRRPWFRDRRCRLRMEDEEIELLFSFPAPANPIPAAIDPEAVLAVRFHFPSTVHSHNARSDVERGNIVCWERKASEYFRGAPLEVEARFDRQSILSATVRVLLVAVALVAVTVLAALYLMVRRGRRQLATD